MRERFTVPCVIPILICASLMAGVPAINDALTSTAAQQVRMMDYLRLYISASDPDGSPLRYEWTIIQDPTAKAYFTANQKTTFVGAGGAELAFPWISSSDAVNNTVVGQSVQVAVIVKHENPADGPETTSRTFDIKLSGINHPPVAVITGTLGTPTDRIPTGSTVIASSGGSFDPDPKDTYRSDWTIGTATGGMVLGLITLIGSEGSTMSFAVPNMVGNVDQAIILQLTDGMHKVRTSATAYLTTAATTPPVTGNTAPIVTVTTPVSKTVGETLVLSGVVTDNDGDDVDLSGAWLQSGTPISPTAITATSVPIAAPAKQWAVTADFGPLSSAGTFQVRLVAQERNTADHKMSAADATVYVEPLVTNQPPVANIRYQAGGSTLQAVPASMIDIGSPVVVTLDASGSDDDGGAAALTYVWTMTDNLTSGSVALTNSSSTAASLSVANSTQGTAAVTLTVTDQLGLSSSASALFNITVPKLTATIAVKAAGTLLTSAVEEGTVITLDGSGSTAADGTKSHLTYAWSQLEGPPVTLIGMDSGQATFAVPGISLEGTLLEFKLGVTDTQTGETAEEQATVTASVGATYFAQVGFGPLGDDELRTVLLLVNSTDQPANDVSVEFFGSDGKPLQAIIDNQWWTNQPFNIPARFSKRLVFGGTEGGLQVGWARVRCPTKLNGLVLYQVVDPTTGEVSREIPVLSSMRGHSFTTYFNSSEETALAVANPTDQPVQITVSVVDYVNGEESVIVSMPLFPDLPDGRLPPQEHGARFIDSSLFGQLPLTFKQGALRVETDGEIIVTTIKTREGVIFSALPLGGAK